MSGHESELLGAYVLGVLTSEEWASVEAHLAGCPPCRRDVEDLREVEAALGEIPPEALLDGPPVDGADVLHDTLSAVRAAHRRRTGRWALAAAVVTVLAVAGGLLAGRFTAPGAAPAVATGASVTAGHRSPDAGSGPAVAPGSRSAGATDPATRASMTVVVQPAAGWVRLRATLDGVPAGEECRLFVVSAAGARQQAASWLSAAGPTTVEGAAIMAPAEVATVQAETYAGQILVAVPV